MDSATETPIPSSFTLINSEPSVYAIDGVQLFRLHQKFVTTPLPSKAMFPWLHGVDGTNNAQNYFFGIEHHHYHTGTPFTRDAMDADGTLSSGPMEAKLPVPEHRGLMFIHASEHDPGRLVGSVSPGEILRPAPRSALSVGSQRSNNRVVSHDPYSSTQQDINNHPQIHHQHSAIPSVQQQLQQQQGGGNEHDPDWADISDDSASSSLCSSSLSSTTSSLLNNGNTTNVAMSNSGPMNGHTLPYLNSFVNSLSEGINIRNFKIQVPRYALLSDMIVYAKEGEQDSALLQLAKLISAAQDEVWRNVKEQYPQLAPSSRRQTFVLTDTFAAFEAKYPELVAVSSMGKASRYKVDFWEQEREQMALLTRASEIAPGIWLGNNSDVPLVNSGTSSLATPVSPGASFSSYFFPLSIPGALKQSSTNSSAIPTTPPPEENEYPPLTPPSFNDHSTFQPSICIECRSGANTPTTVILDRIKNNVVCTPAPLSSKEIFHLECLGTLTAGVHPESFPPSMSSLSNSSRQDIIDVSMNQSMRRAAATALVKGHQLTCSTLQTHMSNLINMAFFIHAVSNPDPSSFSSSSSSSNPGGFVGQHRPQSHQVLIHCVDGYTESALLALSVVMIHHRISLAEAYLKLQTDLGRSFFVYPNDAIILLEVENQVWKRILEKKEAESKWNRQMSGPLSPPVSATVPTTAEPSTTGSVTDSTNPPSTPSSPTSSVSSSLSFFSSLINMTNQPSSEPQTGQQEQQGACQSPTFSGPLPMLMEGVEPTADIEEAPKKHPFMIPGHLDRFEWFYHQEFEGSFPSRILPFLYLGNLAHASNPGLLKSLGIQYVLSVGEEARGLNTPFSGNMEIPPGPSASSRFMVKYVDDMYDNGVDSLWNHLENCVAFVDEARRANARILIHCRVGVSRSATIVIAYLMAHYNLSLVEAYLMVRARRLSVIIQPNLLFMYELLQWEQQLRGRFDPMGWPGIAREVHGLNMYYIGN